MPQAPGKKATLAPNAVLGHRVCLVVRVWAQGFLIKEPKCFSCRTIVHFFAHMVMATEVVIVLVPSRSFSYVETGRNAICIDTFVP